MNHDNIPPSPFGTGTRYDSAGKLIEAQDVLPPPRISRIVGEIATETVAQLSPSESSDAQHQDERPLDAWALAAQEQSQSNVYAGPASRQVDLEKAEVENKVRAAAEAGMTVDQWMASRSQR